MKHHGKCQCHKGNQKDHHWILRFFYLKITDKQHSDYYHCHMDHQKEIFPASSSQQIKERKDDRHRSDWQTLVIVGVLFISDFKVKKPQNPMVILLVALVALALSMMFHLL